MDADAILEAAHVAADELDAWDGEASSSLGGCSPGGVVRQAAHEAAVVSIDECPACSRRVKEWRGDNPTDLRPMRFKPAPPDDTEHW